MTWSLVSWILSSDSDSSSSSPSSYSFDGYEQEDQEQLQEEFGVCNQKKTQEKCEISGNIDEEDDENVGENGGNSSDIVDLIPTAIAISGNPSGSGVTIAIPGKGVSPSLKRRRTIQWNEESSTRGQKSFPLIWSNEDVLELLRSFLEYTSQPRINPHYIHRRDSNSFYDEVKSKLQIVCNKNQVIEKLKRLKRKYQILSSQINSRNQTTFKSSDERAIFEISNKIWGSRTRSSHEFTILLNNSPIEAKPETENYQETASRHRTEKTSLRTRKRPYSRSRDQTLESKDHIKISNLIETIVRGCVSPIFEELLSNAARPWTHKETTTLEELGDERWKKQKVMEMEVYSKRLELVQEHIRMKIEEFKAKENAHEYMVGSDHFRQLVSKSLHQYAGFRHGYSQNEIQRVVLLSRDNLMMLW